MSSHLEQLGQCSDARETLLPGLQGDPSSVQRSDFFCTVCRKMLCDPVTTQCGHSFCQLCLFRSFDLDNKCPLCRAVLPLNPRTYVLSVTLNDMINFFFPEECAERKAEQDALAQLGMHMLPIYDMDIVLPLQKLSLNISGPEHSLMIRRIMEGSHRMGIIELESRNFGCEVEICKCETLADGDFLLQVVGHRRFHAIRLEKQDGYTVAQVDWFSDVLFPNGTLESKDLQKKAREAADLALSWISSEEDEAQTDRRSDTDILSQAKVMLDSHDVESFSFWFANLLSLRHTERLELFRLTDTRERISRCMVHFRAEHGCPVQ